MRPAHSGLSTWNFLTQRPALGKFLEMTLPCMTATFVVTLLMTLSLFAQEAPVPLTPLGSSSNALAFEGVEDEIQLTDPTKDGAWETEALTAAIQGRLATLTAVYEATTRDWAAIRGWVAPGFSGVAVSDDQAVPVYKDGETEVLTIPNLSSLEKPSGPKGAERVFLSFLREEEATEAHFKVIGIHLNAGQINATIHVEIESIGKATRRQRNAVWETEWKGDLQQLLLQSLRLAEYQEVILKRSAPLFHEETAGVLGNDPAFLKQLVHGIDYWRPRMDWRFGVEVTGPHGLALGDVNGDGRDDLYYCESGGLPNRLFVQQADGTAVDVAARAGVDFLEPSQAALLIDLDNDADQDLVVAVGRYVLFYANDGLMHFEQKALAQSHAMARSLSAADFDGDGDLDVYVCGYFSRNADAVGLGRPMPYHDANNGAPNHLLANDGKWHFDDVTDEVGLGENNNRFSYASAWEDYDEDGDLDLYVANDFGRNNLYQNTGGKFHDVAAAAGVEDLSAGMSASWGDYNQDGLMDLYVGNMYSSAGNRIAYQRQFRAEDREAFQRHARGNTLFQNNGDGTFRDVTLAAGVNMGRWAWSSPFVDLNNDGREDLFVANGMVTAPDDSGDL